jgi:hypothetical protein
VPISEHTHNTLDTHTGYSFFELGSFISQRGWRQWFKLQQLQCWRIQRRFGLKQCEFWWIQRQFGQL